MILRDRANCRISMDKIVVGPTAPSKALVSDRWHRCKAAPIRISIWLRRFRRRLNRMVSYKINGQARQVQNQNMIIGGDQMYRMRGTILV